MTYIIYIYNIFWLSVCSLSHWYIIKSIKCTFWEIILNVENNISPVINAHQKHIVLSIIRLATRSAKYSPMSFFIINTKWDNKRQETIYIYIYLRRPKVIIIAVLSDRLGFIYIQGRDVMMHRKSVKNQYKCVTVRIGWNKN